MSSCRLAWPWRLPLSGVSLAAGAVRKLIVRNRIPGGRVEVSNLALSPGCILTDSISRTSCWRFGAGFLRVGSGLMSEHLVGFRRYKKISIHVPSISTSWSSTVMVSSIAFPFPFSPMLDSLFLPLSPGVSLSLLASCCGKCPLCVGSGSVP